MLIIHQINQKLFITRAYGICNYTVNIYRYKAIGANATSSVISTTWKCISPCLEILQLLQVILQPLQDYLQELKDFQTGANAFTGIQNYTGCCISPYSFVPINIYSVGIGFIYCWNIKYASNQDPLMPVILPSLHTAIVAFCSLELELKL